MQRKTQIPDINADLGEGAGNDAKLMPWLTSCNIACGAHAGDAYTIRETVRLAMQHDVKIGAHPSYPDRANFGRKVMDISEGELLGTLKSQMELFTSILKEEGGKLHHVKPHGALYNQAAIDEPTAQIVVKLFDELKLEEVKLYTPYQSVLYKKAIKKGVEVYSEAFADRQYNDDLTLVSRQNPNAMVSKQDISNHVGYMVHDGAIKSINGKLMACQIDTICVHGDNAEAFEVLASITKLVES